MPITSSAEKALRASHTKREYNLAHKEAIVSIVKKVKKLVADKKKKEAEAILPTAYKVIDKAVKTNFIKKNTGARKKSRLSAMINKIS